MNARHTESYEKAPNKRVTVIGADAIDAPTGSARGFDGRRGWDKNVSCQVDGVRLPFRTRYVADPSTITYTVERLEHNVPIDDARFERPKS